MNHQTKNRALSYLFAVIAALCLMTVLFITSVEAVVYWTPGYFEKEYTKYNVAEAVDMTMDDLLDVTDEMMAYLRGKRADLHVDTTMGGVEREFFSGREIAHMEDVQGLFLAALKIRWGCLLFIAVCLGAMVLLKTDFRFVLTKGICVGTAIFFGITALLAGIVSTDFNKYFVMFHHIFFDNDLWILDPETDMLINIVPEGFFSDTALRIGITFLAAAAIVFGVSLFIGKKTKKAGK